MMREGRNPIIALLTDFGLEDAYVGTMKGVIYNINPSAQLVDICHNITAHSIQQASFALSSSYKYFPEGTIYLVVVDPGVGGSRRAIILKTPQYLFVAPDNGVLSFIAEEECEEVVEITNASYFLKDVSNTFHGRDVFAPVAAHLSLGINIYNFGPRLEDIERFTLSSPHILPNGDIIGRIVYIDRFGNLITNISSEILSLYSSERVVIEIRGIKIYNISSSYSSVSKGEPVALIGSSGNLEIAVNCDRADRVLRAGIDEEVKVYLS